jgi:hypothetical protein
LFPIDLVGEDVVEIIGSDETIIIKISLHKNLLDFLIIEVLTEVLGDLLQLVSGDLSLNHIILTALLMSKEVHTLSTSALLSLSLSLAVASLKNSAKSIPPDWSSSSSAKIW